MLIYFEEIDQAVNTDNIYRIYQYKTPGVIVDEDIVRQLEEGIDVTKLNIKEPEYQSTILLKDGTKLSVNQKVKDIIKEIAGQK